LSSLENLYGITFEPDVKLPKLIPIAQIQTPNLWRCSLEVVHEL